MIYSIDSVLYPMSHWSKWHSCDSSSAT